jgi:uncharacterized membrane protein YfcA
MGDSLIFVLVGIVAGVLSGLFGIGGGIVIVPALLFFAKMRPQQAIGTLLATLLLPVGALGAWQYYRDDALDLRAALLIAGGLFFGVYVGARIGLKLPPKELQRTFAVFLVLVAARLWYSAA